MYLDLYVIRNLCARFHANLSSGLATDAWSRIEGRLDVVYTQGVTFFDSQRMPRSEWNVPVTDVTRSLTRNKKSLHFPEQELTTLPSQTALDVGRLVGNIRSLTFHTPAHNSRTGWQLTYRKERSTLADRLHCLDTHTHTWNTHSFPLYHHTTHF